MVFYNVDYQDAYSFQGMKFLNNYFIKIQVKIAVFSRLNSQVNSIDPEDLVDPTDLRKSPQNPRSVE